jgi:D-serine deaminase-like pyridoxal phosphate-dependent protein
MKFQWEALQLSLPLMILQALQRLDQARADFFFMIAVFSKTRTLTFSAGNYVFMDRSQLSKGTAHYYNLALFVYATVVTVNDQYIIIDAGSKVFSSDTAPHSAGGMEGYGEVFVLKQGLQMFPFVP